MLCLSGLLNFAVSWLGLRFHDKALDIAVVWPAAGVALALLLVRPRRDWPALLLGLTAANVLANLLAGRSLTLSFMLTGADLLAALTSAALLNRGGGPIDLRSPANVTLFTLYGAVLGPLAGALAGATVVWLLRGVPWASVFQGWWICEGLGVLAVTSTVLCLTSPARDWPRRWSGVRALEAAALLACFLFQSQRVFAHDPLQSNQIADTPYAIIPLLLWSAARMGLSITALLLLLLSGVVVWHSSKGHGPFGHPWADQVHQIFEAQIFLGIVIVTTLLLAALLRAQELGKIDLSRTVSRLEESQRDLRRSQALFQSLASHAPMMIWMSDAEDRAVYFSPTWVEFTGARLDELLGQGWCSVVHPHDALSILPRRAEMIRRRVPLTVEYRIRRRDGAYRWVLDMGVPRFDERAELLGYVGAGVDITERREAEQRQRLLADELDHRVKNNFAAVLSLAEQTLRQSPSKEQFVSVFTGRVRALARSHEALARQRWEDLDLKQLPAAVLGAFLQDPSRLTLKCEEIRLPARTALPLGLSLHELGTNAAKYGAWSTPRGRVLVSASVLEGKVYLEWTEQDGPAVVEPRERGLGLDLVRGLIEHELGGSLNVRFNPEGLSCLMVLPIPATQPQEILS